MFGYNATIITFTIYILGMILIGFIAYRYTNNLSDYILGGRRLGSFVTGTLCRGVRYVRLVINGASRRCLCRRSG